MRKALKDFFKPKGRLEKLHEHVNRVGEIETEVDSRESETTRALFVTSQELAEKMQVAELVKQIGNIADLSENASDELEFAAMKSVV